VARGNSIGKTIVLLILVVVLFLVGLLWFDYLGVIQAKSIFSPIYSLFGLQTQTSSSNKDGSLLLNADIDEDRLAKRLEELVIREQELDKRESDIAVKEAELEQISQELENRRISQEDREKTFNNEVKKYDDREVNIEQNARYLNGMRPEATVAILNKMEDQDVIDVFRKCEEIAKAEGSTSQVSYWLSLMPADRAAVLQRKMASKPLSIN
jgi:flagellar protein FlbB